MTELQTTDDRDLGTTEWFRIDQDTIDRFADVTRDDVRIHLDPAAARAAGLDSTIAHGLFTVSLGPMFLHELFDVAEYSKALNYGFERVRFTAPVPVDASVRMSAEILRTRDIDSGTAIHIQEIFELRDTDGLIAPRPVCVAESIGAYFH